MAKFLIRQVSTGSRFDLRAPNGESIAASEVYSSLAVCRRGAESVEACVSIAHFADLTQKEQATNPKFQLYQDRTGGFRFRLRARNGKIIAVSESYSSRQACLNGIEAVRRYGTEAIVETETVEW